MYTVSKLMSSQGFLYFEKSNKIQSTLGFTLGPVTRVTIKVKIKWIFAWFNDQVVAKSNVFYPPLGIATT